MIICKPPWEVEIMREAGYIVALTHQEFKRQDTHGITTQELDSIVEVFISKNNAISSFKGYNDFPRSICVSLNNELVHGITGDRILNEGDIISFDFGAKYNGYHGDSAWTYAVGKIAEDTQRLLDVTGDSLCQGLNEAKPGEHLSNISHAIQKYVEANGFSVVREYVGHGVGRDLQEDSKIPHYGPPNNGQHLKPGKVLAIEPMVNAGTRYVKSLSDNWTVVTVDGRMCAHFEHTVANTEISYEILTKSLVG